MFDTMCLINTLLILSTLEVTLGQNGERFLYNGGFGFDLLTTTSLNQDTIPFKRELKLDHIKPLAYELDTALDVYRAVCLKYKRDTEFRKQVKFNSQRQLFGLQHNLTYTLGVTTSFFVPGSVSISNAQKLCTDNHGRLPEFRQNAQDVIQQLCIKHQMTSIPVAVEINNTNLVFPTDQSFIAYNPFENVEIYNNGTFDKFVIAGRIFDKHIQATTKYTAMVDNCNLNVPSLRYYQPDPIKIQPIICEIDNPTTTSSTLTANDVLHSWIDIACTNELDTLTNHVTTVLHELTSVTDVEFVKDPNLDYASKISKPEYTSTIPVKISLHQNVPTFSNPTNPNLKMSTKFRTSRQLELEQYTNESMQATSLGKILDTMGIIDFQAFKDKVIKLEAINKLSFTSILLPDLQISYGAHKFAYDILNYDVSIYPNDAPAVATIKQLYQVTNEINAVVINQQQIEASIKYMTNAALETRNLLNGHMYASTIYTALQDSKFNIYLASQVITNFINKIAHVLLAAQTGKTSIYALNRYELEQIAKAVRADNNNLSLTNKMSDVTCSLVLDGLKKLSIILSIPVTNKMTTFNFYKVIPVPKFSHNATYLPYYAHSHLAISISNDYYAILAEHEFQNCIQNPLKCTTAFPFQILNDSNHHCIISSFVHDTLSCPLQLTHDKPQPFLYFSELQLLYSVPNTTHVLQLCMHNNRNPVAKTTEIYNSGITIMPASCKIRFYCNNYTRIWFSPAQHATRVIENWFTFEQPITLKFASKNITVLLPNEIINTNSNLTLLKVNLPSWQQMLAESFQPNRAIPSFIQILIIVATLVVCLIILKIAYACGLFTYKCQRFRDRTPSIQNRPLPDVPSESPKVKFRHFRHYSISEIPTSNTAETSLSQDNETIYTALSTFKPIPLLDMKSLTESMNNLELVNIEETALTPPLPPKYKPNLDTINEDYIEMTPLVKSSSKEQLAQTDIITVTDNSCANPIYSSPRSRHEPRFHLSPVLQARIDKLSRNTDNTDSV